MSKQQTSEAILQKLQQRFGDKIESAYESYGILTVHADRGINRELIEYLRDEPGLAFTFLKDLCGIHYPFNKGREIGVIYLVYNFFTRTHVRIHCYLPEEDPTIRTVSDIYSTANWLERETYDFYGAVFEGHPNLIRILNVEDMDYFPMLKQYPLVDATREDKDDTMFGR